ncbi:hypothetical protein [Haliea sp. E17]|uniref:hypothetical protein n=1 Tax=Haliea sp. E17 TaxID=3401576 RepID=UPI003AB0DFAD
MTAYPDVAGPEVADDPALAALLDTLRRRYNDRVCGVLLYGSCLRSGDLAEGILDLYLVLDEYRGAYGRWLPAAANWLLPPNVIYAEQSVRGRTLRAKVALLSLRDFQRCCSPRRFESYIWGRFAQPTKILASRDPDSRRQLEAAMLQASRTLLLRALPALPAQGPVEALWQGALALSYATELRTERKGRSQELADYARDFYLELTRLHAGAVGLLLDDSGEGTAYRYPASQFARKRARLAWFGRRVAGKSLSIARLTKALFTFEGALDYLAWKLSRHSGEAIVIPDRVRRAPLLYIWGFAWGLWRRGIFR